MGVWCDVTFDPNGGTLRSPSVLYYHKTLMRWYTSKTAPLADHEIYEITNPTRSNYIFRRFRCSDVDPSWDCVDQYGMLKLYSGTLPDSLTAKAGWRNYLIINLDKGEYGTGGTSRFFSKIHTGEYYSDTSLTNRITSITPPSGGGNFYGYSLNGTKFIDASGQFTDELLARTWSTDKTLLAQWSGGIIDYFNLESQSLVPFYSDSGENRPRVVTRVYGKAAGADQSGPVWRNPTVKYMVVKDMTFGVSLGKSYAKITGKTGFMITSAVVETQIGQFPIVTVSAVANEGSDAINLFNISIPILARARPQNLMGAITGGGSLQSVVCRAVCDPVVIQEGLEPCASDAINGRYEISAETRADAEDAPPGAANSFVELAIQSSHTPRPWSNYGADAVKEIT